MRRILDRRDENRYHKACSSRPHGNIVLRLEAPEFLLEPSLSLHYRGARREYTMVVTFSVILTSDVESQTRRYQSDRPILARRNVGLRWMPPVGSNLS